MCNLVTTVQWKWGSWSPWTGCSSNGTNSTGIGNSTSFRQKQRKCEYHGKVPTYDNCNGEDTKNENCSKIGKG